MKSFKFRLKEVGGGGQVVCGCIQVYMCGWMGWLVTINWGLHGGGAGSWAMAHKNLSTDKIKINLCPDLSGDLQHHVCIVFERRKCSVVSPTCRSFAAMAAVVSWGLKSVQCIFWRKNCKCGMNSCVHRWCALETHLFLSGDVILLDCW